MKYITLSLLLCVFPTPTNLLEAGDLHDKGISVYPTYDVSQTELLSFFRHFSREDDILVMTYLSADKLTYDVTDFNIPQKNLGILIPTLLTREGLKQKNFPRVANLIFKPGEGSEIFFRHHFEFKEYCEKGGYRLISGLTYQDSKYTGKLKDLSATSDCISIYAPGLMYFSPEKFRQYFDKRLKVIRAANPGAEIELCFPGVGDLQGAQFLASKLEEYKKAVDRFGFYIDDRPETLSGLIVLWAYLREGDPKLEKVARDKYEHLYDLTPDPASGPTGHR